MQVMSSTVSGARCGAASFARAPICAVRRSSALRVARPTREVAPVADESVTVPAPLLAGSAAAFPLLVQANAALATGGAFGILEGRTAALVHPVVMATLLGATLYAGYLGWNWRMTRELGDQIRDLRKQLPAPAADGTVAASPIQAEIEAKEAERKTLLAGKFKDKHEVMGSLLLAGGVGIAVEGCVNTWMRTGKLFPGPHLFAGAGIVVLWAMAAALVPEMQKGNNTARTMHIALNSLNVALFLWQVPTGLDIVWKVFEFTSWP